MTAPFWKSDPLFKIANGALVEMPTPDNISILWNFGSLLGMCLMVQITTVLFLAMHYTANVDLAFSSVAHIYRDVNYEWLLRTVHVTEPYPSLFDSTDMLDEEFTMTYMHTWSVGLIILFLTMVTAFLGYVLPWGQM